MADPRRTIRSRRRGSDAKSATPPTFAGGRQPPPNRDRTDRPCRGRRAQRRLPTRSRHHRISPGHVHPHSPRQERNDPMARRRGKIPPRSHPLLRPLRPPLPLGGRARLPCRLTAPEGPAMRVLTTLPQDDLRKTAAAAQAAEAAGYDGALTMENKNDPFLAHAIAAVCTERMQLGTSVAIAFPRSPMVVANTSWDLQIASRGRFVLGIGPQIRPHNERRFSVKWTAPAPRLREYVQSLRAIWTAWETGERLHYEGKHYHFTLMPPYFIPVSQHMKMVPVTLAAVGPHSLRLAGEVADG